MPKRTEHPRLRTYIKRGKDGRVWVSYAYDMRGTGQPDVSLGTDRDEAIRRWAEIRHGAVMIRGTLEEAFQAWLQRGLSHALDGKPRMAATIEDYRKCLAALRPVLGRATWAEVEMPTLLEYVRRRSSASRARHEMQLLAVIWSWSIAQGFTKLPWPGHQIRGWKGPASRAPRHITEDEWSALYAAADPVVRAYMDIASATGARPGDVTRLRLSDVRDGCLVIQASKTGKRLEVPIAGSVLERVVDERRAMRRPEHLFLLADPGRRRPISQRALVERWNAARDRAAADCPSVADLQPRHMRKRAAQLAPDLQSAQALLDHSSAATTRLHYQPTSRVKPAR